MGQWLQQPLDRNHRGVHDGSHPQSVDHAEQYQAHDNEKPETLNLRETDGKPPRQ
jgi:hypothetical protein